MDFREDVIEFEVELDTARYEFVGTCETCGQRCYQCKSHPIRDDVQMQTRVAGVVKTSRNEPPAIYCQEHYLSSNPQIVEQINAGVVAEPTEFEKQLMEATKKLGGAIGGVSLGNA